MDFVTAPPPESSGLSVGAVIGVAVGGIFVVYIIIFTIIKIVQWRSNQDLMDRMVAEAERDIKKNPYAEFSNIPYDEDVKESKNDAAPQRRHIKRSSKVAPAPM